MVSTSYIVSSSWKEWNNAGRYLVEGPIWYGLMLDPLGLLFVLYYNRGPSEDVPFMMLTLTCLTDWYLALSWSLYQLQESAPTSALIQFCVENRFWRCPKTMEFGFAGGQCWEWSRPASFGSIMSSQVTALLSHRAGVNLWWCTLLNRKHTNYPIFQLQPWNNLRSGP